MCCPLVFAFSVGIGGFVIGLGQISFFFSLKLYYIPSECNPADKESRKLSLQDCMLSSDSWDVVEEKFGPHTIREKGRDLTKSCDKNPYTHRTIQKVT